MGLFKEIGKGIFDSLIGNPLKETGKFFDEELTGGVIGNIANKMSKTPKKEKNKSQTYGAVMTLPCVMCPQCKHYEYNEVYAHKHKCKETKSYESSLKIGQNPETDGTAMECGVFEPK